jgi:hypothetical protein
MGMSPSRRLLFLGLFLVGTTGAAQTLTLSFGSFGNEQDWVVGKSACANSFSVNWLFNTGYRTPCSGLQVWVSPKSCSDTDSKSELFNVASSAADFLTGNRSVALSSLPGFKGDTHCGAEGIQLEHYICAEVTLRDTAGNCNNNPEKVSSSLRVIYKATPPPAPVISGAEGYDGQMAIHFSTSGEYLEKVLLYQKRVEREEAQCDDAEDIQTEGFEGFEEAGETSLSNAASSIRTPKLEDGACYRFFLKAIDLAGNESAPSAIRGGIATPTDGFWDIYKQNGGTSGGCHAAGGEGLAWLGLALLGVCIARRLC